MKARHFSWRMSRLLNFFFYFSFIFSLLFLLHKCMHLISTDGFFLLLHFLTTISSLPFWRMVFEFSVICGSMIKNKDKIDVNIWSKLKRRVNSHQSKWKAEKKYYKVNVNSRNNWARKIPPLLIIRCGNFKFKLHFENTKKTKRRTMFFTL